MELLTQFMNDFLLLSSSTCEKMLTNLTRFKAELYWLFSLRKHHFYDVVFYSKRPN